MQAQEKVILFPANYCILLINVQIYWYFVTNTFKNSTPDKLNPKILINESHIMAKNTLIMLAFILGLTACQTTQIDLSSYDKYPVYENNLWPEYSPEHTTLKIWSPAAEELTVKIYEKGHGEKLLEIHAMRKEKLGLWTLRLNGDYKNRYYTFQVTSDGKRLEETPGIYAKAVGVNGKRAMILDMSETNPEGWPTHKKPELNAHNDIVLYELHVRDLTIHPNSGSSFPGKYLGLIESGTINSQGLSTGLDHMKELGITHVHLLPSFDYRSVDENRLEDPQFNWGYDPENYNVPDGSYSSDPFNAAARIREFKEMVMKLHENGIRVIMDVVYNHTGKTENSNFNLEVPGYYYRFNEDGSYSDASGCGNETASERPMMRKYIIESCKYWVNEYGIDGFRFDLMGIHDIETLNELSAELKQIDPSIFVYGEGWTAGGSPLADSLRALKANTLDLTDIASFSDDIRDGIKGSVFEEKNTGFVSGAVNMEESIKFGVVGSTQHSQIDFEKVNYSSSHWANKPGQSISYVSCHDNNTLYDKLLLSREDASAAEIKKMHCLSNAIVLSSQGIPFLHAGVEMMRTKDGEHNSYNKPDEVNRIDWNWKTENKDVFDYYKGLIALRKSHPAFRMPSTKMIEKHLEFIVEEDGVVGYQIKDNANGDTWENILVVYNAQNKDYSMDLPDGEWTIVVKELNISREGMGKVLNSVKVPEISMMMLVQE